jgi:hypothetical protein
MLNENTVKQLRELLLDTNASGKGYRYASDMRELVDAGFAEGNGLMADLEGRIAFRITPAGESALQNLAAAAAPAPLPWGDAVFAAPQSQAASFGELVPAPVVEQPKQKRPAKVDISRADTEQPKCTIHRGFVPPRYSRIMPLRYPVDQLEIGEVIFVESVAERPNPEKSLRSTATQANKRYADSSTPRLFRVFKVAKGAEYGTFVAPADGAVIARVSPAIAE